MGENIGAYRKFPQYLLVKQETSALCHVQKGTDLSTGNIGEISLKLRNAARADFDDFLRTSNAKCLYEAFMQWLDPDRAAKLLVAYGQSVYDDGGSVADFRHAIIVVSRDKRS